MVWYIDCVWLVKQVLWLFLLFSDTIDKRMDVALVTQHVMNACQEDFSGNKTEHLSYTGEWANA